MRILHLVHQYLPEFVGGTELYTQALTRELARRGHELAIFHRAYRQGTGLSTTTEPGVAVYAAADGPLSPSRRFLDTWRQPAMHRHWLDTLDSFAPELVHVQHLMGLPTTLLDVLAVRRIPYVVTLLDYWWNCANANLLTNYDQRACNGPQGFINCTRCAVARAGTPVAWGAAPVLWGLLADRNRRLHSLLNRAAALFSASEFVHNWYAAHGAPAHNLHTVRWGVIPPAVMPPRTQRTAGLNLLYVGGLAPNKGVHIVLDALRGVSVDVQFSIAGDPQTHPEYTTRLQSLADGRVHFLGRLDRDQVWQAMVNADAVVIPSLWHETFCLVAHEALAAGTPVLASAMGALNEAVRDGVDGLLLPPGDVAAWHAAIRTLVTEPSRLAALRAGIVQPPRFVTHVDQVETHYARILGAAT